MLSTYAANGNEFLSLLANVENNNLVIKVILITPKDSDGQVSKRLIGNIVLSDMAINNQYPTVRILSKSDFILEKVEYYGRNFKVVPLAKSLRGSSPLHQIDRFMGHRNQTIILPDHALINFDYVIADDFAIYITNAVSDIMKSFMLANEAAPLITVIIHDQNLLKMRTLKIEFKDGVGFDLQKLDRKDKSVMVDQLKEKLSARKRYIEGKAFLLRHDSRFDVRKELIDI
uniref:Uncharacterized protein n=1 Tax=Romanomermis culicivorax TaxID=13658 RepID=A0A915HPZ3_ROMCU